MPTPFENQALVGVGSCGCHQTVMGGVTVVVGGPENGMNGENFFLSGEEVAPTTFFSSAYDAQYHSAEGMAVPDNDTQYAPQLAAEVVDLMKQPHTFVLDGEIIDSALNSQFYLRVDSTVYFEFYCDEGGLYFVDGNFEAGGGDVGISEPLTPGRYRMAVTRTNGSVAISVNGGSVFTAEGDPLPYAEIGTAILGLWNGSKIREFTIHTTPKDNAELPTLSALT